MLFLKWDLSQPKNLSKRVGRMQNLIKISKTNYYSPCVHFVWFPKVPCLPTVKICFKIKREYFTFSFIFFFLFIPLLPSFILLLSFLLLYFLLGPSCISSLLQNTANYKLFIYFSVILVFFTYSYFY